jgi:ABC-type Mn2+/Zn2+ transport system ATPase subunit
VGLLELASRPFGALSGGQQQRAFLARALVQEPDLLVLDEPVAGVDEEHRQRIGELLVELRGRGVPLLIATHDLEELEPLVFDQHWSVDKGRLVVEAPGAVHAPDHHEDAPLGRADVRPVGLRGLDRRMPSWG